MVKLEPPYSTVTPSDVRMAKLPKSRYSSPNNVDWQSHADNKPYEIKLTPMFAAIF